MSRAIRRRFLQDLLRVAGVEVNGPNPWDVAVHDERFYDRVLHGGALAAGESYVDGWWDCPRLDELVHRVISHKLDERVSGNWAVRLAVLKRTLSGLFRRADSAEVAKVHYDLGNEFFRRMLGRTMVYSCAYWKNAVTLDQAQSDKLDLVCRKLGLTRQDRLLDIGCGWGPLARHAAERYGCQVTG